MHRGPLCSSHGLAWSRPLRSTVGREVKASSISSRRGRAGLSSISTSSKSGSVRALSLRARYDRHKSLWHHAVTTVKNVNCPAGPMINQPSSLEAAQMISSSMGVAALVDYGPSTRENRSVGKECMVTIPEKPSVNGLDDKWAQQCSGPARASTGSYP